TVLMVLVLSAMSVLAVTGDVILSSASATSANPGAATTVTVSFGVTDSDSTLDTTDVTFTSSALGSGAIPAPSPSTATGLADTTGATTHTFSFTVPAGTAAGTYSGTIGATASNPGFTISGSPVSYALTVDSFGAFSLSTTSLSLSTQDDTTEETTFTVTNTGSVSLDISFAHPALEDNDQDQIAVSFKDGTTTLIGPLNLMPGQSKVITTVFTVDDKMDIDSYTGSVTVSATGAPNTVASQTISTSVEVIPELCKDGVVGDFDLSIEEPDDDEEFQPGEEMQIEVNVENNADESKDIVVEASLYNMDTGRLLARVESDSMDVDEDDDADFNLDLRAPTTDFDDSDAFKLFVVAFEDGDEDENCNYESISVDLEREEEAVVVDRLSAEPSTVECGDTALLTVDVKNVGTDEQEDVYVKMVKPELGLDWQSDPFNLDAYDDEGNDKTLTYQLELPEDAKAGTYLVSASVVFDGADQSDEETVSMTVSCGSGSGSSGSGSTASNDLDLNLAQESVTLSGKKQFALNFALVNKGDEAATGFTVDVTELGTWAKLVGLEVPAMLNPGESYNGYAYVEVSDDAAVGAHNFRLNVRHDAGLIASKLVTVNVGEASPITGGAAAETPRPGLLGDKSKLFWIVGDLVLVVLAVVFLRMLFKK
ncbi:putative S-layer protein, partial [Candidatus Woesearchaeota archaeon]|nr:putative S-layer protein [Candidatus Woesearchaeota archaeon]